MRRRAFVFGGIAAAALAARFPALAQSSSRIPRIGIMFAPPLPNPLMEAFRAELLALGYIEGKNIQVEYRSVAGSFARYPTLASELVRLPVDVLVAGGGTPAIRAAKQATSTIPIVFPASRDPVDEGFVQSLARPGGNLTGTSILESEINAKRMQLLKEVLPKIQRIGVLFDFQAGAGQVTGTERAARALGLQLHVERADNTGNFERNFAALKEARTEALIVTASAFFNVHRKLLADVALRNQLVVVWEHRAFPAVGGLMSYGPDIADLYRSAARYVDRILKGAKPAELPVQQASKLELVINLNTAKLQGIGMPSALLVRADQLIR